MTTIDQRILIPAPQAVVWAYISNISNNPEWQAECEAVSFLTSRHDGPGTRWRYTTDKKREYVVEITAWYNGLGYEYIFIDGPGYKENRGRIRLQEIAEGTIVQWTFSYEIGGMLAGLRNHRRHIETTMAASLKELYRKLKQFAAENKSDPKSLMRDAPDVEARSHYHPRHPTAAAKQQQGENEFSEGASPLTVFDEPPITEEDAQTLPTIVFDEPPVSADDTRPRPAVTAQDTPSAEAAPDKAPEYVIDERLFQPPREVSAPETEALLQPSITTPQETPAVSDVVETIPADEAFKRPEAESTPAAPEEEAAANAPITEKHPAVEVTPSVTSEEESASAPASAEPIFPSPEAEHTAASIWEVFGVPRPSETQEVQASTASTAPPPASKPPVIAGQGLRIRVRRRLIRLRRPF